ncbi:MAG TPA: tRNA-dihydrouridine synthase, partial [Terriglobia bacterium]|nr:tRNA-dihydrouridine synthase [Terriglobia bacterium]
QYFATGDYTEPTETDRYELIRTYYAMLVEEDIPGSIGKMKQFASWFTHGVRNGAGLRKGVQSAASPQEVLDRVDEFFLGGGAGEGETSRPEGPAEAAVASFTGCEARDLPA